MPAAVCATFVALTALSIDGATVAVAVEVARTRSARRRGLLGRDTFEGALVLVPCRQVHTLGMRFAIDAAFCDRHGTVVHVVTLRPGRVSRPVWRARWAIEVSAGRLAGWGVRPGTTVVVREHAGRAS